MAGDDVGCAQRAHRVCMQLHLVQLPPSPDGEEALEKDKGREQAAQTEPCQDVVNKAQAIIGYKDDRRLV